MSLNIEKLTEDTLLGFAVGDAYGVPYEFLSRKEISYLKPGDMIGCNDDNTPRSRWGHLIPAGAWSDDTSMIVATMSSVINKGYFNSNDIMKAFVNWWYNNQYTSIDTAFGLGDIVSTALRHFKAGVDAEECGLDDFYDNGNGSLMRILPYSLYCIANHLDFKATCKFVSKGSSLTHAHEISCLCCVIYTELLREISKGLDFEEAYLKAIDHPYHLYFKKESLDAVAPLLTDDALTMTLDDLKESNGYVVETLKAVVYSLYHSHNYEVTIKTAVSIGYDTDTIAGIAGSLAGALYESKLIPVQWIKSLKRKSYLEHLAKEFSSSKCFIHY